MRVTYKITEAVLKEWLVRIRGTITPSGLVHVCTAACMGG